jgi:hypothetical protein
MVLIAGLAFCSACAGDDDDGGNGSGGSGDAAGTGGTGGTGGHAASHGGGTGGTLSGPGGGCPSDLANHYTTWYGLPDCKAYYDCIFAFCAKSPQKQMCEGAFLQQLRGFYCLDQAVQPDPTQMTEQCKQGRENAAQSVPECAG